MFDIIKMNMHVMITPIMRKKWRGGVLLLESLLSVWSGEHLQVSLNYNWTYWSRFEESGDVSLYKVYTNDHKSHIICKSMIHYLTLYYSIVFIDYIMFIRLIYYLYNDNYVTKWKATQRECLN